MIRTYTPADLATIALPGSLPGLLKGWCGPAAYISARPDGPLWPLYTGHEHDIPAERQRLPLSRWEARARVAAWLEKGRQCDLCGGTGRPGDCSRGHGRDFVRAPVRVREWLDWPGGIEPWVSASLLHASALRAVAGMGAVADLWCGYDARRDEAWSARDRMTMHVTPREWARGISTGHALLDGDSLRIEVPS